MIYALLFSALLVHADTFKPKTTVELTQDFPDPEGFPARKCGALTAGRKGTVVNSPYNGDALVEVVWSGWTKACGMREHHSYVPTSSLQIAPEQEKVKPDPKPPKNCEGGPSSRTMEELLRKTSLADKSEIKSPENLEKYIACYYTGDHDEYLRKYKPMIESAAETFNVDSALMKCLLLRESQYDPLDMSCTCATGLGQQVTENIKEINKWVGDSHGRVLSGTKAENDVAQAWDDYMTKLTKKDSSLLNGCSRNFDISGPITDESNSFYRQMIAHREKGCGKNPTKCTIYREDDRRCGAASIAATAAYLGMIEKILAKAVACHQIEWWQVDDSRIALALAYNAGEGTAQKALNSGNKLDLMSTNILENAKVSKGKRQEMYGHFRAIHNCMQKDNTGSQSVDSPEKKACFGPKIEADTSSRSSR